MKRISKLLLKQRLLISCLAFFCIQIAASTHLIAARSDFNHNWQFVKDADTTITQSLFTQSGLDQLDWESVSLPHTANIEPLVITGQQWQGYSFYRKFFTVANAHKNKHIAIDFEGAMQIAEVFLNGELVYKNYGGYLPFYVDISEKVKFGKENALLIRLNNKEHPEVPPGKPLDELDFCYYSGIYRNVTLVIKDKLHISNSIAANRVAGGGVFVSYSQVSSQQAMVNVNVDLQNDHAKSRKAKVKLVLADKTGNIVAKVMSPENLIRSGKNLVFKQTLTVSNPMLWNPDTPNLYSLTIQVLDERKVIDSETLQIGIRTFSFSAKEGFVINGKKIKLRGTNRHQEYPYIGNALSDNAQYRDAYKIKLAGYNFVRVAHYPKSPAFLSACDALGIMVLNAIPGWQFMGNEVFQKNSIMNVRKMVRRDRNHPSIILWEASINETTMSHQFMLNAHNAVKEELPQGENYTCGWQDEVYDVFIPARQHATAPDYWKKYRKDKPLIIAEYGDWEYYAHNAGFNQTAFANLAPQERTTRQLRGDGQKRLAQQALNYQESFNDNQYNQSCGDANWLIFDYNRGYAPDIEASGVMDIFRLPKFAFYFYQSQASFHIDNADAFHKPMIYIANYWNDSTFKQVKVYSNCEEVELSLNGVVVGLQKPDKDINSTKLKHPPFTFDIPTFRSEERRVGEVCRSRWWPFD